MGGGRIAATVLLGLHASEAFQPLSLTPPPSFVPEFDIFSSAAQGATSVSNHYVYWSFLWLSKPQLDVTGLHKTARPVTSHSSLSGVVPDTYSNRVFERLRVLAGQLPG
jgi:hypothetical protein